LLYTPVDDPSLIWLEVLPGAVVSTVWVTFWMAAGMALLSLFGVAAPWDLLPVFAFVAAVTSYWAAMGRMLGFMLFPREGAAGGAWSFLLSPVSAAGIILAAASAGVAGAVSAGAHWHSWGDVRATATGQNHTSGIAYAPVDLTPARPASGVTVAAAGLAGIVATLGMMLALIVVSFAAFFLLGAPAIAALAVAGALWGAQLGFGSAAPLQGWFAGAGGIALLALALNTGSALPIYWSLIFGSGRRLDRLREAWSNYWALFRGLVIPACALFGVVVFRLLAGG
jgi:hypothetical protein